MQRGRSELQGPGSRAKVVIAQFKMHDGNRATDLDIPGCAPQEIRAIPVRLPFENRNHIDKALQRVQREDSSEWTAPGHFDIALAAVRGENIGPIRRRLHYLHGMPADCSPGAQLAPFDKGAILFGILVDRGNEALLCSCRIARQQQRQQLEALHLLAHPSNEVSSGGNGAWTVLNAVGWIQHDGLHVSLLLDNVARPE